MDQSLIKKTSILISISLCSLLIACTNPGINNKAPELIKFKTIEANTSDTLSVKELFFREKYSLELLSSDKIETEYISKTNKIIVKPENEFEGLTFIKFKNEGMDNVVPIIVKKKAKVVFTYKPKKKIKKLYVMGNFNTWNRSADEMKDEDGDGIFERTVFLDDGVYEYQFVEDKREFPDPENPEKVDNGFGSFNSLKRVVSSDRELSPYLYFLPYDEGDYLQLALESGNRNLDMKLHVILDNQLFTDNDYKIEDRIVHLNISSLMNIKGLHTLRIVASINNIPGNILTVWIKDGQLLKQGDQFLWHDAIIYSLMIDRFNNGDTKNDRRVDHPELSKQANFNGGDFAGITRKIENGYFDSLGINTIWISPVNKTTDNAFKEWPEPHRYYTGYHGYWPVSPRETESRFGSLQEFKTLVKTAHKHNIKILLDFISNHTHIEHEYYKTNPEWFGKVDLPNGEKNIRRWDEYRLTTWFDTFLPSFDFLSSDEAINRVTDDAVWWLEETGIDGFRHDATKHVPFVFWESLTNKIKSKINPNRELDVYQIGETFGSHDLINSYVNNNMLDAQFNFNQFFNARRIFSDENGDFSDLKSSMEKSLEIYGYNHLMGNLMDSHDQVRMMALFDSDITLSENSVERAFQEPKIEVDHQSSYKKELMYYTYMLTIPGIPIIYFGDEYGATGAGDPDNRRMMRFGDNLNSLEEQQLTNITNLIFIRKNHSALRQGDYKIIQVSKDVMAYTRGDFKERLIIVLNKSNEDQIISLDLPGWINNMYLKSLITNKKIIVQKNNVKLKLTANSGDIFKSID